MQDSNMQCLVSLPTDAAGVQVKFQIWSKLSASRYVRQTGPDDGAA